MSSAVRIGLRTVSVVTIAMACWLAVAIVAVLPVRDPDHLPMWSVVAAGSVALVALSMAATRHGVQLAPGLALLLGVVSAAALAFGLLVLGSELTSAPSGDPEGYLLAIGAILTAHGALGLGWLGARILTPSR